MAKTLGLDLGTNSIGWAVVDKENNAILDSGVRIFPMGVVDINQGEDREMSKNATRRIHRQTRRQVQRKRLRKVKLLEVLIKNDMCPLTIEQVKKWWQWDKYEKTEGRVFPDTKECKAWLKMNPYELRAKGVEGKLTRYELGRVLYHLIQRRGFVSSRKEADDKGAIYKGKDEMKGIIDTKNALKGRTLGQYLNEIKPDENEAFRYIQDEDGNDLRPRGRYTLRAMYVDEFERIWKQQAVHLGLDRVIKEKKKVVFLNGNKDRNRNRKRIEYLKNHRDKVEVEEIEMENDGKNKILTKVTSFQNIPLHDYLGGKIWYDDDGNVRYDNADSVMFYQRPLRSQKSLLGKCRYEQNKSPVSISHPDFEKYRIWQFVNTIRLSGNRKLPLEQRNEFVDYLLKQKKAINFEKLIKQFKLGLETFNYEDDKSITAAPANAYLKPLFAADAWEEHYHEIWHDFYFYDDTERLYEKLKNTPHYKLKDNVDADTIDKIKINTEDYASLSLKAIKNILPFLERGYEYNEAVLLGGVMNAFNSDQHDHYPRWERFSDYHDEIISNITRINREKGNKEGEAIEKIKAWLSDPDNSFGFSKDDSAFKKLYHHSQEIEKKEIKPKIAKIENLRNPVVQRSVQEMRRLVNKLMEDYGRFDRIAVEMGRELKQNKQRRNETQRKMSDNEKANKAAMVKLTEYGLRHSRENVQKYLLFEEIQNKAGKVSCPYTGRSFNISDLLGDENKIQIEHIVPRSKSQNDSFANKTLCDAWFNQQKGELTPYEFYQKNKDPKLWGVNSWPEVEQRAYRLLPFHKARRFSTRKEEWDKEEFVSRQLNDDRYISKKTKEILSEVCKDVVVMPGAVTADLRRLWGLNNVLQPNYNFEKQHYKVHGEKALPHWAVLNEKKEITGMYPQINPRPDVAAEEMCLTGFVDQGSFEVKEMKLKLKAPEELDKGRYYAKIPVKQPRKLVKKYVNRPETGENEIVLRGKVSKKKFKHDSLKKQPDANNTDGFYYARFKVMKSKFEKPDGKSKPENKNGIVLYGNVKDGVFTSYVYKCNTNLENGQYWVLLDLDFENAEFIPTENEKPTVKNSEFLVLGDVNDEHSFTPVADATYNTSVNDEPGRYWAVFEISDENPAYTKVDNPAPNTEKEETLIEGKVWVDSHGEIRFDPKKNRDDHRHHAVDAIVIALTERGIINEINHFNANVDEKRRNNPHEKPSLPDPWENFRHDVQHQVDKILVSHHRDNPVLKKVKKKIQKNGKTFTSEGYAVRGQLHKETIFGERKAPGMKEAYHVRKPVKGLKDKQIKKIVDDRIRKIIKHAREQEKLLKAQIDALQKDRTKAGDEGEKQIDEQIEKIQHEIRMLYTLPNKRGERVPIKKVRIREKLSNAQMWKPSKERNQQVNPRNNHHVLIYKDADGNLKEEMITLWEAAEKQISQGTAYAPPGVSKEILTTLEENDMFLIGLSQEVINNIKWDKPNGDYLSRYMYRVQKISSMDYTFRHHLSANLNDKSEKRIQSFKAWERENPVKVKISIDGKIEPYN